MTEVSRRSKRQREIEQLALEYVLSRGLGSHFALHVDIPLTVEETVNLAEQEFEPHLEPAHHDLLNYLETVKQQKVMEDDLQDDVPEPRNPEKLAHMSGVVKVMTTEDEYRTMSVNEISEHEIRDGKVVVDDGS